MRLIDADELNEYIGRESLDTREKIFALVDRMPTLPNPCGKPCAFERPHGEWIFTGRHNAYGGAEIECSNCHTKLMVSPSRWEIGENFCDVCGSRNKKEGDRNE